MIIQKKARAKINLYLKILNKRPDGYHNIYTVMQKISLCDDVKITIKRGAGNIAIACSGMSENIPANETNTAYKAAESFLLRAGIPGFDIGLKITKNIPNQAGLGGGSSDAASVLLALNEHFGYILPENEMLDMAAAIGADVPFFVVGANCAVCEGIGEIVTPATTELPGPYCLIVKPVYNVSTKQAYEDFDKYNGGGVRDAPDSGIYNDFAAPIFSRNKNIEAIYGVLTQAGAAAGLSGSGSALFGIFGGLDGAKECAETLKRRDDIEFCDIFDFL